MRTQVEILKLEPREVVQAELFDEVTVDHFLETQLEWRPVVLEAAKELQRTGTAPNEIPGH